MANNDKQQQENPKGRPIYEAPAEQPLPSFLGISYLPLSYFDDLKELGPGQMPLAYVRKVRIGQEGGEPIYTMRVVKENDFLSPAEYYQQFSMDVHSRDAYELDPSRAYAAFGLSLLFSNQLYPGLYNTDMWLDISTDAAGQQRLSNPAPANQPVRKSTPQLHILSVGAAATLTIVRSMWVSFDMKTVLLKGTKKMEWVGGRFVPATFKLEDFIYPGEPLEIISFDYNDNGIFNYSNVPVTGNYPDADIDLPVRYEILPGAGARNTNLWFATSNKEYKILIENGEYEVTVRWRSTYNAQFYDTQVLGVIKVTDGVLRFPNRPLNNQFTIAYDIILHTAPNFAKIVNMTTDVVTVEGVANPNDYGRDMTITIPGNNVNAKIYKNKYIRFRLPYDANLTLRVFNKGELVQEVFNVQTNSNIWLGHLDYDEIRVLELMN
jgi:hypothetical protein